MRLALGLALVAALSHSASCQTADERQVVGAIQHAAGAQTAEHQEESYQRVYEAFTKLLQNVSNNSLGNARRLVSRLNQLVGSGSPQAASKEQPAASKPAERELQPQPQPQSSDEKTEQILNRLDQVNKNTDQHTLRQLQEDVNRLVGTLSESYLRNVRRVIERVNKTIGSSEGAAGATLRPPGGALHQSGDRYGEASDGHRQPGFPGWDELITAVDRMQKSLASFVRSSTKLITAGR